MTTPLHERMKSLIGNTTFRALGQATDHNPETVRRYMAGQAPSVEFLSALVGAYAVNAEWLLTGRGPLSRSDVRQSELAQADPNELMAAIARQMEDMCDRIDRIEIFTQTMETRLRASSAANQSAGSATAIAEMKLSSIDATQNATKRAPHADQNNKPESPDDHIASRATRITDAIPDRPRPDAG